MELNQFTDYSLRALMFVALKEGEICSVKEIAKAYSISENHLVKVIGRLGKKGFLQTIRGRNGGLLLARDPADIGVGSVVRAMEPLALVECMPPRETKCCIAGVCGLQTALWRATAAFMAELDKLSLADLVANRDQLKERISPV